MPKDRSERLGRRLADAVERPEERERLLRVAIRDVGHWLVTASLKEVAGFRSAIAEAMGAFRSMDDALGMDVHRRLETLYSMLGAYEIELEQRTCAKCRHRMKRYFLVDLEPVAGPFHEASGNTRRVCTRCKNALAKEGHPVLDSGLMR